jgi:ubiquitin carboxyl-terminal hydrolase L3
MISQPIAAMLLLYPLTKNQTSVVDDVVAFEAMEDKVWFMKQRIGNACGTIGLLHALQNIPEAIRIFAQDSWLLNFAHDTPIPLSPIAKAERLEKDNKIAKMHDDATNSETNATDRGNLEDKILTHFIAFVCVEGKLYELDGRKEGPILHGATSQMTLLKDSCQVIKKFMARDPEEMRFSITALAPKQWVNLL